MPAHEDAEVTPLYLVGLRLREPLFAEDYLTTEAELHVGDLAVFEPELQSYDQLVQEMVA